MSNLKSKLTSRKFWITLVSVIAGVAQLLGADGNIVSTVSGALLAAIPAVIYVITEGKIDAEGVKKLASSLSDSLDVIAGDKNHN